MRAGDTVVLKSFLGRCGFCFVVAATYRTLWSGRWMAKVIWFADGKIRTARIPQDCLHRFVSKERKKR